MLKFEKPDHAQEFVGARREGGDIAAPLRFGEAYCQHAPLVEQNIRLKYDALIRDRARDWAGRLP